MRRYDARTAATPPRPASDPDRPRRQGLSAAAGELTSRLHWKAWRQAVPRAVAVLIEAQRNAIQTCGLAWRMKALVAGHMSRSTTPHAYRAVVTYRFLATSRQRTKIRSSRTTGSPLVSLRNSTFRSTSSAMSRPRPSAQRCRALDDLKSAPTALQQSGCCLSKTPASWNGLAMVSRFKDKLPYLGAWVTMIVGSPT